jgi:hypothetical protein
MSRPGSRSRHRNRHEREKAGPDFGQMVQIKSVNRNKTSLRKRPGTTGSMKRRRRTSSKIQKQQQHQQQQQQQQHIDVPTPTPTSTLPLTPAATPTVDTSSSFSSSFNNVAVYGSHKRPHSSQQLSRPLSTSGSLTQTSLHQSVSLSQNSGGVSGVLPVHQTLLLWALLKMLLWQDVKSNY